MVRLFSSLFLAGVFALGCCGGTALAQQPGGFPQQNLPQYFVLTEQSLPQMLQQAGYQTQAVPVQGGATMWKVQTQPNLPPIELMLVKTPQGQVLGLSIASGLKQVNANGVTGPEMLKLLQENHKVFPYSFTYNTINSTLCLQFFFTQNNSNKEELKRLISDFETKMSQSAALWNLAGQNAGVNQNQGQVQVNQVVTANMVNSNWSGTETFGGVKTLAFQFQANGQVVMVDFQGNRFGTWTQNGNQITISIPSISTTYTGTISGNTFTGQGSDPTNGQWTFNLTKTN